MKMLILLPLLGVLFNGLTTAHVEANLSLEFKATKLLRQHNPANCTVGNTTYAHGQTFKLDCKTQCVCENGRHACSSLCPKEQLPAPEDTISCRSPRLVEVPGHCCKMWLCENPTADVYATCHNASTSPWTPCSQPCGLGISTRFASTNAGCRQLSSLRLCENRKCDQDNNNGNINNNKNYLLPPQEAQQLVQKATAQQQQQQLPPKHAHAEQQQQQKQLISHNVANNLVVSEPKDIKDITDYHATLFAAHEQHRIRKGHECRSLQRLGPARIRLGVCISRKLYRPKLCGLCHQHSGKCCRPSVSTTIQVELLCPLNAEDPISIAEQQQPPKGRAPLQLWDTVSLEPIDQEFLQSHQIQIENKFIAVEWILKCECGKYENCNNLHKYTTTMHNGTSNSHKSAQQGSSSNRNTVNSWRASATLSDRKNNKTVATNIISETARNNNDYAYNSNNNNGNNKSNNKNNNANISGGGNNMGNMANSDEQNVATDNDSDNRYVQQQQQEKLQQQKKQQEEEETPQQGHLLSSSGELQPDIIPYPAMLPPHRSNPVEKSGQRDDANNNNNSNDINSNYAEGQGGEGGNMDTIDSKRAKSELNSNNNDNMRGAESVAGPNKSKAVAGFGFYSRDDDGSDDNSAVIQSKRVEKPNERDVEQQNALREEQQQEDQQLMQWKFEKNLHYQRRQFTVPTEPDAHWSPHYTHHHHQPNHRQHHHHHHHHQHQHQHHLHHQQHHQQQETHSQPQLQQHLWLEQLGEQQHQQQQPELHELRQRST
ncbi:myb-like protein Q isoform X1 [Bactrocera tryoni]|uniref:myb-like protein Q isoform X1 n=2 Tax=Bactrocera tryoni TaxID=59916 RepID=UPI001A986346|nr:myb-like protein Q isoform X1 [Bactrocera tryoni]XP_039965082.1 myb-like protein Q isoform X1 [Bactrocera tryoni]XP_039965083.1 myb-like protein Q isoform X1 [Bactrocera tryoni]